MSFVFAFLCASDPSGRQVSVRFPVRGLTALLFFLTVLAGRAQIAGLPAPTDRGVGVSAHPTLTWSYSETNLLSNGGFEEGTNGWVVGSAQRVTQFGNIPPAEGSFLIRGVGGVIQRDLVLPTGHNGLRLSFKTVGSFVTPNLLVELTDESGPPLPVAPVRNLGNGWRTYGADLSAFAGRPVRLTWQFVSNDNVAWGLDDVRLTPVPVGTEFEVWFSTNQLAQLTLVGRTSVSAWPLRFLPPDRRFYWRVDTIQGGETNRGPVWQFQTDRFLNLSQLLVDPLSSSAPARLRLASLVNATDTVTIEPGARETPFLARAIDNRNLEGSSHVTVQTAFANWKPAQTDVEITDDETNTLTVSWLGSESLKEGQPATEVSIVLGGLVTNAVVPLTVTLDPPGRVRPPPALAVPPGSESITLPLEAVDDGLKNGRSFVTVRISSPGWQDAVFTLPVFDDEPARFRVQLPPGPLPLDQSFMVTALPESVDGFALPNLWLPDVQITARDAGGPALSTQVGPTFANEEGMQIPVTLTQGGGLVRILVEATSPVGPVVGESAPVAVWSVPTALNLTALVFDEARNRLLAISPQQPLVALDLATGARRPLTPALSGVAQAVWAGGDTLYASWLENRELARINLPSLESGVTWPVGTLLSGSPLYLRHFLPLPGQPDGLIVGREGVPGTELAVFEGTNARPLTARFESEQALSLLQGQSPGQVFAVTPDRIEEFAVTPEGIQRVTKLWSLRLNYDRNARPGDSVISQGQVLTGQGELLDPSVPGRLGDNSPDFRPNAFATDPHTGRLAWYQSDWDGRVIFRLFDPLTLREVWRRTRLENPAQYPSALVSAGPHRWAVLVNGRLQLETDEAPDLAPATDLSISTMAVTRNPATSTAAVQWRIENRGSNSAPDVRLMLAFPETRDRGPAAMLVTAISTNAVPGTNGLGGTSYALGDLAPGASVEVTADLRAALNGRLDAAAWIGSTAADPDPNNNRATVTAEGLVPQLTLAIGRVEVEQELHFEFPTNRGWDYHLDFGPTPGGPWEAAAGYRGTGEPISLRLPAGDGETRFWRLGISDQ